jgi:hypothetical protein
MDSKKIHRLIQTAKRFDNIQFLKYEFLFIHTAGRHIHPVRNVCEGTMSVCVEADKMVLEQSGFHSAMSRKANDRDKAPMESFRGTLKNELIRQRRGLLPSNRP